MWVQGSAFKFRVEGLRFGFLGLEFGISGLGAGFRVQGLGLWCGEGGERRGVTSRRVPCYSSAFSVQVECLGFEIWVSRSRDGCSRLRVQV